ncbi:hypothetical protein SALBM135S_02757 [Streptomyces alboniger]
MTSTPRTWVVGEVVNAATMNSEIRDQFNSFFGAWTTWTPTWLADGGAAPTLNNGSLSGRYMKVGRTVDWVLQLTWGSTPPRPAGGGASENWMFTLPAPPATASPTASHPSTPSTPARPCTTAGAASTAPHRVACYAA